MTFNAQLNWDTSKVTNMYATFNTPSTTRSLVQLGDDDAER